MSAEKTNGSHFSRRNFIKGGLLGLTALAAGGVRANWDEISFELAKSQLEKESLDKLERIIEFRSRIKLSGLPGEIIPGVLAQKKWDGAPRPFDNQLPINNNYAAATERIIEFAYGENDTRMVRGVLYYKEIPDYTGFYTPTRKAVVGTEVKLPLGVFIDTMVHELIGHPTDPALAWKLGLKEHKFIYPPDMLVSVEHGIWQALSRAFSIEGQLLNHPLDLNYPVVSKKVGEVVAKYFMNKQEWKLFEATDNAGVYKIMMDTAVSRGTTLEELRFNKAVCREIGDRLVRLYLEDKVTFAGEIKEVYEKEMEEAMIEIYAETVRIAIVHPDLIQYDSEILTGVSGVLEAIYGRPIDLGELKNKIFMEGGLEDINQPQGSFPTPPLSVPQILNTGERLSADLIMSKEQTPLTKLQSLREFIVQKYPQLRVNTNQLWISFDPPLHLWEIEKIEWAIDSGFFDKFNSGTQKEEDMREIKDRMETLKWFIESDAF